MRWKSSHLIWGTALVAFLWVIARAAVQAISIDEATTYLGYVQFPTPDHWRVNSNNHVLNSALMRLCTSIFGLSAFTMRLPALAGAGLYIWACVRMCRLASADWFVQWPLLMCLVYNPFVFDYLVAARGYGMALAFLMLALVNAAEWATDIIGRKRSLGATCAISSACLALSFASNFSFAFVDAAAFVAILGWLWAQRASAWRLLASLVVPGIGVTYVTVWWTARHFAQGELWYGATTVAESLNSFAEALFYRVNPELANATVLPVFTAVQPLLLPLLLLSGLAVAVLCKDWRIKFAVAFAGIGAAAFGVHWVAHLTMGLMLPKDRTGIYLPILLLTAAGLLAGIPTLTRAARSARGVLLGTLFALGIFFLFCMRLDRFKEWPWNANADKVYARVSCLNRELGVRNVSSVWMQEAVLNVYRLAHRDALAKIVDLREDRPGTQVYVTNFVFDQAFMIQRGLKVIYHDETEATIAVTPDLAERAEASVCAQFPQ